VGAGASGLACARILAEAGLRVALLEARDRVGGRIYTVPSKASELPVELGAEFIHGLPEELIELVDEAGLTRFELDGEHLCFEGHGPLGRCAEQPGVHRIFESLAEFSGEDMTFAEWVAQSGADSKAQARATNFVEGFNAAEANRISMLSLAKQQAAENAISGDRLFRVAEGYQRVPEFLLRRFLEAGGAWNPSTPVASIIWRPGKVEAASESGVTFSGRAAVVALPLGVLHARQVTLQPEPTEMLRLADSLAMGTAARVVYELDSGFWQKSAQLREMSFLFVPGAVPPTWWTAHPKNAGTITGWLAGRKANGVDLALLPQQGLSSLAEYLGEDIVRHVVAQHTHDWSKDRRSLGAYTYVPAGAFHASEALAVPVDETLFFAGEHTDTSGHWGTVHGALRSGHRAAKQLLAAL
jgi:monoamine oxidase